MKRLTIAMLFLIMASLACSFETSGQVRGSGNIVKHTYAVKDFDQVELNTIGEVFIKQGDTESLTIETDDNILPLLDPKVENGRLILREEVNGHNYKPSGTVIYTITVKDLSAVTTAASGDITIGALTTDKLSVLTNASGDVAIAAVKAVQVSIKSDGSGSIKISDLEAESIQISSLASGKIQVAGSVTTAHIATNGSGEVLAGDLHAAHGDVSIQASGSVAVWIDDTLGVAISGSGNLKYYGAPALTQNISGSGKLESLGKK